jgi:plastocyanin
MARSTRKRPRKGILNNTTVAIGAVAVLAVTAAAAWLAFEGGGGAPKRSPLRQTPVVSDEQQVSVSVIDNDFTPRTLTVNKGATVTWTFDGDLPHNVTDDRGAFASETLGKGESYARTFDAAGVFYYYCTIHHAMLGTLTVRE